MKKHQDLWEKAQREEEKFFLKVNLETLEKLQKDYIADYYNILPAFDRNMQALDVCCGPRSILRNFPILKKRIALDSLNEIYISKFGKVDNIISISGRGETLPFKDNIFDIIFCINALDHTENWRNVLREILRVCKAGGMIYLDFEQTNYIEEFLIKSGWRKHLSEHHLAKLNINLVLKELEKISKIKVCKTKYVPSFNIGKVRIFFKSLFLRSNLDNRPEWERDISATNLPFFKKILYCFIQLINFIGFLLNRKAHAYFVKILIKKIN